jgi:hypothetical protein
MLAVAPADAQKGAQLAGELVLGIEAEAELGAADRAGLGDVGRTGGEGRTAAGPASTAGDRSA